MKFNLSLLSIALFASCSDGPASSVATLPVISLPDSSVFYENRSYQLAINNEDDFSSVSWQQVSGVDYGWQQVDGVLQFEAPELPIGETEVLTFKVTAQDAQGVSVEKTHTITLASNDRIVYLLENTDTNNRSLHVYNPEEGSSTTLSQADTDSTHVASISVSPMGDKIAFRAALDSSDIFELFVVSIDGGTPIKINVTLDHDQADVSSVRWLEDGTKLIYRVDSAVDNQEQLYLYDFETQENTLLSGVLVEGGSVGSYELSFDEQLIAFRADAETDGISELYVVDLESGLRTKVNKGLVANGNVNSYRWAPDSSGLAYFADADVDGQFELYYVDKDGSNKTKLNPALTEEGNVSGYGWLPDSSAVVFRADDVVDSQFNLWVSAKTGESTVRVNQALPLGGTVSSWALNEAGSHLVYRGDVDTDGVIELYIATIAGTSRIKLNDTLVENGDVSGFTWLENINSVIYLADQDVDSRIEMYAVQTDGGSPRKLSQSVGDGDNVDMEVNGYQIANDESYLVYSADQYIGDTYSLFTVNLSNDSVTNTLAGISAQANSDWFEISPKDDRLATVLSLPAQSSDLYIMDFDGANKAKINVSIHDGNYVQVQSFDWAPDASRLIYIADETSQSNQLYLVNPDTSARTRIDVAASEKLSVHTAFWR